MSWRIKFSNQAVKFIRKLDEDFKERIKQKFLDVCREPFHFLEHFEGEYYKLRIGDFRALLDIDFENKILWVRIFDKRGRIYK